MLSLAVSHHIRWQFLCSTNTCATSQMRSYNCKIPLDQCQEAQVLIRCISQGIIRTELGRPRPGVLWMDRGDQDGMVKLELSFLRRGNYWHITRLVMSHAPPSNLRLHSSGSGKICHISGIIHLHFLDWLPTAGQRMSGTPAANGGRLDGFSGDTGGVEILQGSADFWVFLHSAMPKFFGRSTSKEGYNW